MFSANMVILSQICDDLLCSEAKFPRILRQNDLEDQGQMTFIFNNSWENAKMHIWCKFCNSSSNTLQVIAQTNQISYNFKSK